MNQLLSTINSEIENKITAQNNGEFWKSLLGDPTLLRSLGLGTRTYTHILQIVKGCLGGDDANRQTAYIEDVLREARQMVTLRSWHLVVVDTVKVFVQKQTVFLNEAYATVMDEMMHPHCPQQQEDDSSEDSYDEEGTDIFETGSSAFHRAVREDDGTVIYDDEAESETSDKSAYDVSHTSSMYYVASSGARHASPDSRMSSQDRARHVAESSLEPLECSDADVYPAQCEAVFFSDGEDKRGVVWDGDDSEMDTGEHQSFDRSDSPPAKRQSASNALPVVHSSRKSPQKPESAPKSPPEGILFFRWATKLGRRGKDILTDSPANDHVRHGSDLEPFEI